MLLEIISWVCTLCALYGTWLNSNQDRRGFYYWVATNVTFALIFVSAHMWAQAFLFGVYTALAIKGLMTWKKKD
jgi:hypothetical protein